MQSLTTCSITRTSARSLRTTDPASGHEQSVRRYVARVTAVFNNNGSGVRGDMKALIRAILTDAEARQTQRAKPANFGKLREPVVRFVHMHRAFNAKMAGGSYRSIYDLTSSDSLGQNPLKAPSVFNFTIPTMAFRCDGAGGFARAEFEITNSATLAGFMDFPATASSAASARGL